MTTVAESIELHLRLSHAACEWNQSRQHLLSLLTEPDAPGRAIDEARRDFRGAVDRLAEVVQELGG